jgi:hypothetical protein
MRERELCIKPLFLGKILFEGLEDVLLECQTQLTGMRETL